MARKRDRQQLEDMEKTLRTLSSSTTTPEQIVTAYHDLAYTIKELAQHEKLSENELRGLSTKLHSYLDLLRRRGVISWDDVEYGEVIALRHPVMEGRAVKIRALLERMTEPLAVSMDDAKHLMATLTFCDLASSDRISSIPTINTDLVSRLNILKERHHIFDILATVVLMPMPFREDEERFCLLVHDLRPSDTTLQMVQATKAELEAASCTLTEFAWRQQSVFDYVYQELVRGLDIRGLEHAPELRDSLEAMIVQAFSDGLINNASAKLHTLIIGAPAVGKKLLIGAARVLNPTFEEAHPSKATAAGVSSTAVQESGIWRSRPGYLPLAHRGVFAIQDFHAVRDAQREKLLGIFNQCMEDGEVIDSTAARQKHPALTSIHVDLNKRTDLFPDSQLRGETIVAKRLDDIRIPMTALSRFDFIIDIPRDTQRQIEIALAMYERMGDTVGVSDRLTSPPAWTRQLKVLVAFLRTTHEYISFPDEIKAYMQQKHQALSSQQETLIARQPWLSDVQTHLSNSAYKFAAAYARMNHRSEPLAEDIDRTFRLIQRKVDFLTTLAEQLQLPTTWIVPQGRELEDWLQAHFAGQEVETGEILAAYTRDFNIPLVRRTLERHLPQVASPLKRGIWVFPPAVLASQGIGTGEV